MSRDRLEQLVEAIERLIRSDLVELVGREGDLDKLKAAAGRKIEKQKLKWVRKNLRTALPDEVTWILPDPLAAHQLPLDLALWFLENARSFLNGDAKTLDSALGVSRRPGHPVDLTKSKNLDLAEKALTLKMQGKTWPEINSKLFDHRKKPPDERYIRTLVERYRPVIMTKWREEHRCRWIAGSEERRTRSFLRNKAKGKPDR